MTTSAQMRNESIKFYKGTYITYKCPFYWIISFGTQALNSCISSKSFIFFVKEQRVCLLVLNLGIVSNAREGSLILLQHFFYILVKQYFAKLSQRKMITYFFPKLSKCIYKKMNKSNSVIRFPGELLLGC